jgi:RNA polymerase sigma-70 factor (ECF subfamily)
MNTATTTLDDVELIASVAAGDHAAFEALVTIHGGKMMTVARRFLRDEQDVNDAIQDALVGVFRNASKFQSNSKLSTWLHRITVNSCLMKLRSQRRKHEVKIEDMLPTFDETGHQTQRVAAWGDGPLSEALREETRQNVRTCIEKLPEEYRSVLLLRDIEQMDTDETAKLLDCSAACVKTRLHRARQALRKLLAPMFEGDLPVN